MTNQDYMDADEAESPQTEKAEPSEKTEESTEHSCLINKTAWADAKPGDRMTFEALHVYEDEVSVKPVSSKPKAEEAPEDESEPDNAYME